VQQVGFYYSCVYRMSCLSITQKSAIKFLYARDFHGLNPLS